MTRLGRRPIYRDNAFLRTILQDAPVLLRFLTLTLGFACFFASDALARSLFQPPGANLTYGDVTHGARLQSASSNPAAPVADLARNDEKPTRGTVVSAAAGLEFGNVDELFKLIDKISGAYEPSDPGDGGGGPGQDPDKPPGGIDIGDILDQVDPDVRAAIDAVAREVGTQLAILAIISVEGYGKAWLSGDAPFLVGKEQWGGAWAFGVNWYGVSKAFGIVEPIRFNAEEAIRALEDYIRDNPQNLPARIPLGEQVVLTTDPSQNSVILSFDNNDSSLVSKSTTLWDLNAGYSRPLIRNDTGTLFAGLELHAYLMRLSRLSVRYGDITDSKELFDSIRNADYESDNRLGFDVGVLWVSDNYSLGAQLINLNEPEFEFPDVNLRPYRDEDIIRFLQTEKRYQMEAQLKLEGSLYSRDRRWAAHLGVDANAAKDPLGDEYQWATFSAGLQTQKWWAPSLRVGIRQNLAGTELRYLSLGATLFSYFNLDISSALDTTKISGTELPRGLMLSLGFQLTW